MTYVLAPRCFFDYTRLRMVNRCGWWGWGWQRKPACGVVLEKACPVHSLRFRFVSVTPAAPQPPVRFFSILLARTASPFPRMERSIACMVCLGLPSQASLIYARNF